MLKYNEAKRVIVFCRNLRLQPDPREVIAALEMGQNDVWVDDVRFIKASAIDEIWTDSLIEEIKDCYDLSYIPGFIVIDWEQTVENCKVEGMGHHFNQYDGGEEELTVGGTLWYVFDNG